MAGAIAAVARLGDIVQVRTRPCMFCGETHEFHLDADDFDAWQSGVKIQQAFPELEPDDRETLISGSCGECFDKAFGGIG